VVPGLPEPAGARVRWTEPRSCCWWCCCRPRGSAGVCPARVGPLRPRGRRALDPGNPEGRARHEECPGARPVVRPDARARNHGVVAR